MITDELREWGNRWEDVVADEIDAIADRIDEQHRKALEKVAAMVDEPDETERRIKALEHLTEGMLLEESELRERVSALEGFNPETRFVPFVHNAQIEGSWVMTG